MQFKRIDDFAIVETFLQHNFSAPTHWPDWNMAISKLFHSDFYYLGAFIDSELTGICPLHAEQKGPLNTLHSGKYNYIPNGGWIFSKPSTIDLQHIPKPALSMFHFATLPLIREFNVTYEQTASKKTLLIDLRPSAEDIWQNAVDSKRRNMIRKAEKNGLSLEIKDLRTDPDHFYGIYTENNERYKLPSLPQEFFTDIVGSKNIQLKILWAKKDNAYLSAVALMHDKNYAIYWLGLSNTNERHGQGDYIQWQAIKHAREAGCSLYDLSYIEKEKLPHIYRFKKGFSKSEASIVDFYSKSSGYRIVNKLKKILL